MLVRARAGDEAAFAALVRPYRGALYSFLVQRAGGHAAAEDLFQETLVRVWRGLAGYDDRGRFGAWLFTIARRVAIDASRRAARRPEAVDPEEMPEPVARDDPEAKTLANELRALLLEAVDELPEEQRDVLSLRQHGGLAFREIAEETGAPLSTVLSRMHYAVTKLRKVVEAYHDG